MAATCADRVEKIPVHTNVVSKAIIALSSIEVLTYRDPMEQEGLK